MWKSVMQFVMSTALLSVICCKSNVFFVVVVEYYTFEHVLLFRVLFVHTVHCYINQLNG